MKKTEKLYDLDAYATEFEATVVACERVSDTKHAMILDRTLFFPEEGGQCADTGTIDKAKVLDVQIKDGIITHFIDTPLEVGKSVSGKIDFAPRFRNMQNHSGEHIVSGLIHTLFGFSNVGFHLGKVDVTADYDGVLDREMLDRVEELANEAVYANLPIKAYYPKPAELAEMSYRAKLSLDDGVRIVIIGDVDACACCAPHVASTGEIGIIKILDFEKYKGGTRIYMLSGMDALHDYRDKYRNIRQIAVSLSSRQTDAAEKVSAKLGELADLHTDMTALQNRFAELVINSYQIGMNGNICITEALLSDGAARKIATALSTKADGVAAVFYGIGDIKTFVLASAKGEAKSFLQKLSSIGAKGGGTDSFVQGKCTASKKEIKKIFEI